MSTPQPLMSLEGIVKTFPAVRALDNVSLAIMPGEVHALVGENGAGKSTLMKVLAGMHAPDQGRISIRGKPVVLPSPLAAKKQGVVLIHQELSLAEELSVAENIFLGELPRKRFGQVDWSELFSRAQEILDRLGCDFGPKTKVARLSTAKKQMVEIARALTHEVSVVVFDEPTASLTDQEKVVLFEVIADLRAKSVGIVYISHRMEEIFKISDRISALRDGTLCGTVLTSESDEDEITRMMIGRSIDYSRNTEVPEPSAPILEVEGLSCGALFQDISFSVSPGEVVGFYGLVGAGRTEIAETLFGLRRSDAGEVRIGGERVQVSSPVKAIAHGISLVPESRKEQGLVLGLNGRLNISLPQLMSLRSGLFMDGGAELEIFDKYKKLLDIRTPSWRQAVGTLSGGNQQKVVIAKWLAMNPKVLIVDEPTRGIDVGAKAEIHRLIRELARSGLAVIVISSEMPEILHVSDRVLALHRGRIAREFSAAEVNEDNLVRAISGIETSAKVA